MQIHAVLFTVALFRVLMNWINQLNLQGQKMLDR